MDVVGDLHHDHSEGHRQAGHTAEKGDGAQQSERAGVHPGPVLVRLRCEHCHFRVLQWSAVRVTPSGNPRDLNFSRTVAGITKWFWVTIEGYLSYLLPKFEDLIPTSLGDIAI